jgi:hypothetical protein
VSHRLRHILILAALACAGLLLPAGGGTASASTTGGAVYVPPPPPAKRARIVDGKAIPPRSAPRRVKAVIRAANRIVHKPYIYGGGHRSFRIARGYDCSGAVSYALRGGRFIRSPLASGPMMRWGRRGRGRWITVYANRGHAYMVVAGLRFDTSLGDRSAPRERRSGRGPRWRQYRRSPRGFVRRHPRGY